jgi:hypothetical protein
MRKIGWLFLVVMTLWGCSKKSPTIVTVTPATFVLAEISLWRGSVFAETVSVFSDSVLDVNRSSAQLSFGTTQHGLSKKEPFPWGLRFRDTLHLPPPGMFCSMLVATNSGQCQGGRVSMPGPYRVVQPSPYDTLPWDSATVFWSASSYATWYDLWVRCYVYDNMRQLIASADTVLIMTGTSVLIPKSFLLRDAYAAYANVYADLYAHDGAMPGSANNGKLTGNFNGYLYSTYVDANSSCSFFVGTPRLAQTMEPFPSISAQKRRQAILHAFEIAFNL